MHHDQTVCRLSRWVQTAPYPNHQSTVDSSITSYLTVDRSDNNGNDADPDMVSLRNLSGHHMRIYHCATVFTIGPCPPGTTKKSHIWPKMQLYISCPNGKSLKLLLYQMSDFKTKVQQIRFRLGLRPRPRWLSLLCFWQTVFLTALPRPPSWI